MIETPQSRRIQGYAYDPATKVLSVQFKSERDGKPRPSRYDYQQVPPETFAALEAAESKGGFITANVVKGNPFAFEKVDLSAEPAETAPT